MAARAARSGRSPALPAHVAVIMDGNGRWARQRALPRGAGHHAGIGPAHAVVEHCAARGVEVLTLFAFSSENFRRPPDEVNGLMSLFLEALDREVERLSANGIRLRFIGDLDSLGKALRDAIRAAERRTEANRGMTLVVAVAYGGRWDITRAARRLAEEAAAGRLDPRDIDEAKLSSALSTSGLPAVDLLIRAGGEKRISNFLLWDIAYAEVYFTASLWPDFTAAELERAFEFYAERQRRFGRTGEQVEAIRC